jgi:transcriptional regulator GlxA family with amidase domain
VAITGASLIETTTVAVWRNGAGALLRKPFRIDDFRASVTRLTVRASLTVKADPPLPASISRVLAFLADHCGETLRLETLSEVAGVSAWHLSRTFHHSVGVPMRTYIRDLRLDRAQEMLASSPRASLTDVALDAGFYDLPHFDKAFRARYGLSPSEFRRKALIS